MSVSRLAEKVLVVLNKVLMAFSKFNWLTIEGIDSATSSDGVECSYMTNLFKSDSTPELTLIIKTINPNLHF